MQKKNYQIILEFTFLLFIFLSPFHHGGINLKPLTVLSLISLFLLFLWLWEILQEGKISFLSSPLNLPLLFFLLIVSSSIFHSIDKYNSIYGAINFFNYAAIFFVLTNTFKHFSQFKRLIRLLFAYCTLLSLFGLLQYFSGTSDFPLVVGSRAHSLFVTPNTFAAYLILIIPLMCASFLVSSDRKTRFLLLFIIVLNFSALLATYSRSGWLAFLLSLLVFIPLIIRKKRFFPISRIFILALVILVTTGLFFNYNHYFMKGTLTKRIESIQAPLEAPSARARLKYWESAGKIIKQFPIFGTGMETFHLIYPSVKHPSFRETKHFYAHNDYLQIFSESGIIGLLALFLLIFTYLRLLFRSFLLSQKPSHIILTTGIFIGSLALFIDSFFEFNFYIAGIMGILFFYFVLISVIAGEENLLRRKEIFLPKKFLSPKILNPITIVLFAGFAFYIMRPYLSEISTAKAISSMKKKDYKGAARAFGQAVSLSPLTTNYRHNLGNVYNLLSLQEPLYRKRAEREYLKTIELSPYNAENYSSLGLFYIKSLSSEEQKKSICFLKKACQLSPTDESHNLKLALAYQKLGKQKEAIEQFLIYGKFHPDDLTLKIHLAECYFSLKNEEKARSILKEVLRKDPKNSFALSLWEKQIDRRREK